MLLKAWWEPEWNSAPIKRDGRIIFEPYKTVHPAHYSFPETLWILSKIDFRYTMFMVLKDFSRFFSDENMSYEVGDTRLDTYYRNFEGNFDRIAAVGSKAYDFELKTTNGGTFRLSDYRGKPVALMFVAITCPPAVLQREVWAKLEERFGKNGDAKLVMVYSIEQHPGERGYKTFVHPKSFDEKMAYAKEFAATTDINVAVDTYEQTVLTQYDPLPNPAYVIDADGHIAFKSSWADAGKVGLVLETLIKKQSAAN